MSTMEKTIRMKCSMDEKEKTQSKSETGIVKLNKHDNIAVLQGTRL